MLDVLCISDLHFGEGYAFLDYPSQWNWNDQQQLQPFYRGVASLAGLTSSSKPEVEVDTLVLLGDIFELATARIQTAATSGRNFFEWLFQWLHPSEVVYVPGNHDHVVWMWWQVDPGPRGQHWWLMDPDQIKTALGNEYESLNLLACVPWQPQGIDDKPWREELIYYFFGSLAVNMSFSLAYPAYVGPPCGPPGFRGRPFSTLFTHGHLNDPLFVRPKDSRFVGRTMHWLVGQRNRPADMTDLSTTERSTWNFTNEYWYPPKAGTTWGEMLYLFSLKFDRNNPCLHQVRHRGRYVREPAPDLKLVDGSTNDFYNFLLAALGESWYLSPYIYVYGHTHSGGALPLEPSLLLYNTGGWLRKVKDYPINTHLFAITTEGAAKMIRVDFA